MRVLVTGGTGFVGSHLVDALLARGDEVHCLVRTPKKARALAEAGARLIPGDLDDAAAIAKGVQQAELVFHLAALARAPTRDEMFHVNRDGTARLMDACAEQSAPPTVVLVSTVAAGGPASRGQVRIESDPPTPVSIYGESKLAGEIEAMKRAARVPLTIVRPGIVFGPRDPAMLEAFRALRQLRIHPTPGLAPPPLSWIYIKDLIDLLLLAAERGCRVVTAGAGQGSNGGSNGHAASGLYYATCSEYPSWAEMGRMVRPMLARPHAWLISVPAPIAWCVASVSESLSRLRGQPEYLSRDKIREALVQSWACSPEAARRDLAFTTPKPLLDRFQETVDWYRAEKWL
jgi:nucleoside-diphosphate-sugar epimerase